MKYIGRFFMGVIGFAIIAFIVYFMFGTFAITFGIVSDSTIQVAAGVAALMGIISFYSTMKHGRNSFASTLYWAAGLSALFPITNFFMGVTATTQNMDINNTAEVAAAGIVSIGWGVAGSFFGFFFALMFLLFGLAISKK